MTYIPGTPIDHDTDEFAFFAREIARQRGQNPDSLHKRAKITVTATPTVTRAEPTGTKTRDAIASLTPPVKSAASPDVGIVAAWFDEYPIGPSSYYNDVKPLAIGRATTSVAPDLLCRPNDRIRLEDVIAANTILKTASVQYGAGENFNTASGQVGGTHYGNPATDVYAFAIANDLDALQFNVVKYVTRFRKKDGLKDLKKAMHTLERLIAHEEAKK